MFCFLTKLRSLWHRAGIPVKTDLFLELVSMIFPLPQLQIMGAVQLIGSAADACGVGFLQIRYWGFVPLDFP